MKYLALIPILLSGCASFDAAHIEGQKQDANKYAKYSDVELQKQVNAERCFERASTDIQVAFCSMLAQSVGITSTFAGRPTATSIAPTTLQSIGDTVKAVAPYAAASAIAKSVSDVQSKDPIVVQQPAPVIVRPEVVIP